MVTFVGVHYCIGLLGTAYIPKFFDDFESI
jgi:hypothetical protein